MTWGMTLLILGLLIVGYTVIGLPSISSLEDAKKTPSITVRAENGLIIGTYGDIYGDYLTYKDFPKHLIHAVLATEDRNFFQHYGIDPAGVLRALFINVKEGRVAQGGSTITQQLAKNLFLTSERTLKRKLQEMLLAFWLEGKYTKQEILTLYLNRVYLGAGNYGVDAASRRYFGKSASQITLAESAILTGLLKAPSRYAPTSNPKLAQQRAKQVLLNMVDADLLTESAMKATVKELNKPMAYREVSGQGVLYFTDWILDQLPDYIGDIQEDLTVTTTLNPDMQRMAEEAVGAMLDEKGKAVNASQAALVSMTPEGAVKALVGGRNYRESQFNRITQAKRQPGSSFKLFVYLAALEAGYTPSTVIEDRPVVIGKWQPRNYSGTYEGLVSLRYAFAHSINTVAVQLSEAIGRNNVVRMAKRLGISSNLSATPSIALGSSEVTPLELTAAYGHLASGGNLVYPYGITEIRNSEGDVLFEYEDTLEGQAIGPGIVAMMDDMLMAVVEAGTGAAANIGRPVAGKTGTSQEYKDAWFIGFTPQLITGVWAGNDNAAPMNKVTGGSFPARIWGQYMQAALKGQKVEGIPRDPGSETPGFLPWGQPQGLPPDPNAQPDLRGPNDVDLSPGFWEKLFDKGKVEYDYPDPRRH